MSKPHIIQLISHPIQYQTPLYERIAADEDVDFEVWFCSKVGVEVKKDVEFGVAVQWDIPLLTNYKYKFLKNYARQESLDTFTGLCNYGIIKELMALPAKSIIWVHGWNSVTLILAVFVGKFLGHRIFLRGDNTAVIEEKKANTWVKKIKTFWLSKVIFKLTDTFLAVGKQNMDYYRMLNVPEYKIVFAPHSIDNQRFTRFYDNNKNDILKIRQELGIPLSKKVIICSGKYIDKKRPLDLLQALTLLPNRDDVFVVFVGEGNLRSEMEQFIQEHDLGQNVLMTGFINQSLIPQYYLVSDLYVMCSGMYETWGLSTNEAMCFGLPVILSDMVGSAYDLVDGNGFMYPSSDIQKLSEHIYHITSLAPNEFLKMKNRSKELIEQYSYDNILSAIKKSCLTNHKILSPVA
jgi:glycosyltransferase involved in cell wall biosynthesis